MTTSRYITGVLSHRTIRTAILFSKENRFLNPFHVLTIEYYNGNVPIYTSHAPWGAIANAQKQKFIDRRVALRRYVTHWSRPKTEVRISDTKHNSQSDPLGYSIASGQLNSRLIIYTTSDLFGDLAVTCYFALMHQYCYRTWTLYAQGRSTRTDCAQFNFRTHLHFIFHSHRTETAFALRVLRFDNTICSCYST